MSEKLAKLKEWIIQNKKIAIMSSVAIVAVIAIVITSVIVLNSGSRKEKVNGSGDKVIKNEVDKDNKEDSEESSKKENALDKDDKEDSKDDSKEDGSEESSDNGETTKKEDETTSKNEEQTSSSNGNGSSNGNVNNNTTKPTQGTTNNNNNNSNNNNSNNNNSNNNNSNNNNSNNNNNTQPTTKPQQTTQPTTKPVTPTPGGEQGSNAGDKVVGNAETIYKQLFDINNKVTITLDISDTELKKLQDDYDEYGENGKSPIYRRANMTVNINGTVHTLKDVGVRMKGNSSRCDFYNGSDVNNRNLVHFKISFDETFDNKEYYGTEALKWTEADRKVRKSRTFATLNGLELKWNRNFDGTYISNWYTNQMFKAYGVYAQSTNLCNVKFGGYNYGVYTVYEPVDGNFLERYLGSDCEGDMYKCAWASIGRGQWAGGEYTTRTLNSVGQETPYKSLIYDKKTNKSKAGHASLQNLINTLASCSSKATFQSVVDTDYWVKFAAVSYFAGNADDMRNNYNNHLVYFKKNGKAVFIPYDNDRTLGITIEDNVPMYDVSPYSDEAKVQHSQNNNPLYKLSVTRSGAGYCKTEYGALINKIASSEWMKYSNYQKYYNIAKKNYSSVAIPDSNVKAYVRGSNKNTSNLAFSETYTYEHNVTVKTYMSKIVVASKKN